MNETQIKETLEQVANLEKLARYRLSIYATYMDESYDKEGIVHYDNGLVCHTCYTKDEDDGFCSSYTLSFSMSVVYLWMSEEDMVDRLSHVKYERDEAYRLREEARKEKEQADTDDYEKKWIKSALPRHREFIEGLMKDESK